MGMEEEKEPCTLAGSFLSFFLLASCIYTFRHSWDLSNPSRVTRLEEARGNVGQAQKSHESLCYTSFSNGGQRWMDLFSFSFVTAVLESYADGQDPMVYTLVADLLMAEPCEHLIISLWCIIAHDFFCFKQLFQLPWWIATSKTQKQTPSLCGIRAQPALQGPFCRP